MLVDILKAKLVAVEARFDAFVLLNHVGIAAGLVAVAKAKVAAGQSTVEEMTNDELQAQNAQLGDLDVALDALNAKIDALLPAH